MELVNAGEIKPAFLIRHRHRHGVRLPEEHPSGGGEKPPRSEAAKGGDSALVGTANAA
jgi:hypothetical protein